VSDIFNKSIVFLKVSEQKVCKDEELVKPLRFCSYIDYATETRSMANIDHCRPLPRRVLLCQPILSETLQEMWQTGEWNMSWAETDDKDVFT
jgi:hypothetical protein